MNADEVRYVLHPDVEAVVLDDQDEVLVARRGSRTPPQLVSPDAMALLDCFRRPATLVEAVLTYCARVGAEPMSTLDAAFGTLVALTRSDVLVADDEGAAEPLRARYQVGERVGPATITARVRVLRDSEIWRATLADGTPVVVKVVDDAQHGPGLVRRELAALALLQGSVAPRLVWDEVTATGGILVLEDVDGEAADLAALTADDGARARIVVAVVDAYVRLHAHGILHGDVHPGNVLVRPDGTVVLIDFGLASVAGQSAPRTVGGEHLDPVAAAALRADVPPPPVDEAAEQYALAALVYRLLTGATPLDLACERPEALRRLAQDRPRPFVAVGAQPWPLIERVLRRALATDPARRYRSVRTLRLALVRALGTRRAGADVPVDVDLRAAIASLDVDGQAWELADEHRAAHVAWLLRRVAALTGDPLASDLADVWCARAGHVPLPAPDSRSPLARAHRALDAGARTGRPSSLRAARRIAQAMGTTPQIDEPVDVLTGSWAGALLALESVRPAFAVAPG